LIQNNAKMAKAHARRKHGRFAGKMIQRLRRCHDGRDAPVKRKRCKRKSAEDFGAAATTRWLAFGLKSKDAIAYHDAAAASSLR
jgi:hypothetical protein